MNKVKELLVADSVKFVSFLKSNTPFGLFDKNDKRYYFDLVGGVECEYYCSVYDDSGLIDTFTITEEEIVKYYMRDYLKGNMELVKYYMRDYLKGNMELVKWKP